MKKTLPLLLTALVFGFALIGCDPAPEKASEAQSTAVGKQGVTVAAPAQPKASTPETPATK